MTYRLLVAVVALALILLLLLGFWLCSRLFLNTQGEAGGLAEKTRRLTAWTFAGFGIGLVGVGIGAPILGTLAFIRTARQLSDVSLTQAILWGAAINILNAMVAGGILVALVLNQ